MTELVGGAGDLPTDEEIHDVFRALGGDHKKAARVVNVYQRK